MIKEIIVNLVEGKDVGRAEAYAAMLDIMSGEATPAQIGGFITALRIRGETPEIVAGCVQAMREKLTRIAIPAGVVVDTCGTGGDGTRTFNISTAAAFVVAGANVMVAKHGNRCVSSHCGSADVLAELGVDINLPPEKLVSCLKEIGIAFLFAPNLHPAMKHALGPRRELGIRSIFNILGPLSNPAGAQHGVIGVYSKKLVELLANSAAVLGAKHLFVVHGMDGLDEITTTTKTHVGEVKDGQVNFYYITPEEFGFNLSRKEQLTGGDPAQNARAIRSVLAGEKGPHRDIVLINAAAAIVAGGKAKDLASGLHLAAKSIDSKAAQHKLDQLISWRP